MPSCHVIMSSSHHITSYHITKISVWQQIKIHWAPDPWGPGVWSLVSGCCGRPPGVLQELIPLDHDHDDDIHIHLYQLKTIILNKQTHRDIKLKLSWICTDWTGVPGKHSRAAQHTRGRKGVTIITNVLIAVTTWWLVTHIHHHHIMSLTYTLTTMVEVGIISSSSETDIIIRVRQCLCVLPSSSSYDPCPCPPAAVPHIIVRLCYMCLEVGGWVEGGGWE